MRRNISLLIFATICGVTLSEATLRLAVFGFPSWSHPVARLWRVGADNPKHGRFGSDTPMIIGRDDPVYGPRYQPGLKNLARTFDHGVFHISTSNRFIDAGWRDDRDKGEAPLLALGDSFTLCYGVESEHCWVNLLARKLGVEFANLGMDGGGQQKKHIAWNVGEVPTIQNSSFGVIMETTSTITGYMPNLALAGDQSDME